MLSMYFKHSLHDDFQEHTNYSGRNLPGEGIVLRTKFWDRIRMWITNGWSCVHHSFSRFTFPLVTRKIMMNHNVSLISLLGESTLGGLLDWNQNNLASYVFKNEIFWKQPPCSSLINNGVDCYYLYANIPSEYIYSQWKGMYNKAQ